MSQRNDGAERAATSESKFYLPAGVTPARAGSRVERVWAALFNHRVGPRR